MQRFNPLYLRLIIYYKGLSDREKLADFKYTTLKLVGLILRELLAVKPSINSKR